MSSIWIIRYAGSYVQIVNDVVINLIADPRAASQFISEVDAHFEARRHRLPDTNYSVLSLDAAIQKEAVRG